MSIKKSILGTVAAGAVAAATLTTLSATTAHAAPRIGDLRVNPSTGTTALAPTVKTLPGQRCAADSSGVNVYMSGPGMTEEVGVLNGFQPANTIYVGDHIEFSVQNPFDSLFEAAAISQPEGAYTVRLACVGPDFFEETGEFTQVLNFTPDADTTAGTRYVATYAAVVPAEDTTTTVAGPATSTFGEQVTFNADVNSASGEAINGSIQFKDDVDGAGPIAPVNLGSPVAVSAAGGASYTASNFGAGPHNITAAYSGGNGFNPSTSSAAALTVAKATSSVTVSTNTGVDEPASSVFTATVGGGHAGTVQFKVDGVNKGGAVAVTGGTAELTTSLAGGTYTVTCDFLPSDSANVNGSTAAAATHVVDASLVAVESANQQILVDVPAGTLTISVEGDALVDLGEAVMASSGAELQAAGTLDTFKITDTRSGDLGWTATGSATDFVGADTISAFNLGWTPKLATGLPAGVTSALSPNQQGLLLGGTVASDLKYAGATDGSGLGLSRDFAHALDDAGNGTAYLAADVTLRIPTETKAGNDYSSTLTVTVVGQG